MGEPTAAQRWRAELAAWAIDPAILAAAPEPPYRLPPAHFQAEHRGAFDPGPQSSRDRALEALPAGGAVLDVGCGAGAASLALAPPAQRLVGVDELPDMLAAFARAALEHEVAAETVEGSWPAVAGEVGTADVVVCHHVLYNVADAVPFVRALTEHARRRVVVELTAAHPWVGLGPLWARAHGQPRPSGPTAELGAALVHEAGYDVQVETGRRRTRAAPWDERVATMRRRLCLPIEREAEVAAWMREAGFTAGDPAHQDIVTLWWEPSSSA
ncbi:MAG TPA: class I SAM-dependent methyltransferase [Actinomycetes bacterium]|nr:class I SAM-dependent methyltransferase [Actinomycetes bacterium]